MLHVSEKIVMMLATKDDNGLSNILRALNRHQVDTRKNETVIVKAF